MGLLSSADERFGVGDDAIDAPIAVLTARVALGMELQHPHDVQHVPAVASPEIPWLRLQLVPRPAKVDD